MPTVLRIAGFRVAIFPPPREHGPPHVHVFTAGGAVIVNLAVGDEAGMVRRIRGMSTSDIWTAVRIVEEHEAYLLDRWREYHGSTPD